MFQAPGSVRQDCMVNCETRHKLRSRSGPFELAFFTLTIFLLVDVGRVYLPVVGVCVGEVHGKGG